MQIHLSPRHLRLTAATHSYIAEKVGHLEEIAGEIIAAHVVLLHDKDSKPDKAFSVKVHLAVPGPDIHAEDREATLHSAIDLVIDKVSSQLRKRKTKRVEHTKHKAQVASERRKRS